MVATSNNMTAVTVDWSDNDDPPLPPSAPTTALRGKNISKYSPATFTTILAVPHAVLQYDALDEPVSLSEGSQGVES